ncbi:ABC transporter permease [Kitasatospora viridis]|uniref:Putative ABC transport system permease protein n=1 Tax=Kitasatospora viridis TaxID=281105 RepID=A0A561UBR7_9ACTN|nr:FtsX-like permease family protein [Kitasatospora viridis]TWF96804.1 putative ABC transport system permease protein [Kitasatospora viridis]
MSNGLARASVRFRPASFVGSFLALLLGAAVITGCGVLLQTGLTAHLAPVRYADAPVVVAADPSVRITVQHGQSPETVSTPLPEQARIEADLADLIARQPGVAQARPELSFTALDGTGASRTVHAGDSGAGLTTGGDTGLRPGAQVTLNGPTGSQSYRISAVDQGRSGLWLDPAAAERLAGHPGTVDAITVQPRPGVGTAQLAAQVRAAVDGRAKVFTGDDRAVLEHPQLLQARELLTALGGSFGGIAAFTAVFVVMGTIALAVGQRAREFALLRAIGATPRQIRRTIATEALLLAPAAGALGILPGLALAHWWLDALVRRGMVPDGVSLSVGPVPLLAAVGAVLLAALAAGRLAARRPAKLRPGLALSAAALDRGLPGPVRTAVGLLATVGGVVLSGVAASLNGATAANTALGVVMCFLLAVALLGPWVARLAVAVLGWPLRHLRAPASLAADNARANARRLASAITPIVMVTGFCGTLLFLQSTLSHESVRQVRAGITADQVVGASAPGLPAGSAQRAAELPGVRAAAGVLRGGVVYRSDDTLSSATALGVSGDPAQLDQVLDLGLRSGSTADLARPGTVALDAGLADSLGARLGQPVALWLGDGTQVRPTLVATYQRGLGFGQVLLPRADLAAHVTAGYDSQLLVRDAPGADRAAVAAALAELSPGLSVTDAAGFTAQANKDQEINAWANRVMAGVLGGFAALAAANTLAMTVLDRRREVGLLRLAGTTRRQVRGMLRWEALLVAATGLLLGGAIAWITLIPVTRGLAGTTPYVPAALALPLAGAVLALAVAATALPGRALLRTRPVAAQAR